MSNRFVRNIQHHKIPATEEPLYTNQQNDIISDDNNIYIRHRDKYLLIASADGSANGLTKIFSDNPDLLSVTTENGVVKLSPKVTPPKITSKDETVIKVNYLENNVIELEPLGATKKDVKELSDIIDKITTDYTKEITSQDKSVDIKKTDNNVDLSVIDKHPNAIEKITSSDVNRLEVKPSQNPNEWELIPHDLNGDIIKGAIQNITSDDEKLLKVSRNGNNITLSPQPISSLDELRMLSGDENHLLVENTSKGVYKFTPQNIINDISSDNADLLKVTKNNNDIVLSPAKQSYDDTNLQEQIKGLNETVDNLSQKIKELTDNTNNKDTYNPIKSVELYVYKYGPANEGKRLLSSQEYPKPITIKKDELTFNELTNTIISGKWFEIFINLTNEEKEIKYNNYNIYFAGAFYNNDNEFITADTSIQLSTKDSNKNTIAYDAYIFCKPVIKDFKAGHINLTIDDQKTSSTYSYNLIPENEESSN